MEVVIPFPKEQRMIHALLLNSSFIDNLGLFHGKMGIAICFFHLARKTKNHIYEEYAGELIDEIYDELSIDTHCDFENGLAGIGWGINYLNQKGFIDADINEVLEEFDKRLAHEIEYHAPRDISVLNGIAGCIWYFAIRIKGNKDEIIKGYLTKALELSVISFEKQYSNNTNITEDNLFFLGSDKFDLSWELPWILWCLSDILELKGFKSKTKRIISQLVTPITDEKRYPILAGSCLMLLVAFEKLRTCGFEKQFLEKIEESISELEEQISRDRIQQELAPQSVFIQKGTAGISFLYKQLQLFNSNPKYVKEASYWHNCGMEMPESDQGYAGFFVEKGKENHALGVMNGVSGIVLSGLYKLYN